MSEIEKFPLLSGHISMDLVNTEIVRRGHRYNILENGDDLCDWLNCMTTIHPYIHRLWSKNCEIEELLERLLEIRQMLRETFESIADGHGISNEFIDYLETNIKEAPFTFKLIQNKLVAIPQGNTINAIKSLIAYDALKLIGENKLKKVKKCLNPDCVLLFIDEGGRRKWCSMKICGNRQKVARYQKKSETE
ncbi:CGNR zinc finger domain-containing protein [Metabacillus malikii]|uniref:RNA-binding Zn ribbon-like protein n=1 Tax=Metabacillus malikii TaxID=1504265 RepID=A0ABT9ZJK3_9BACI|nr:CGNR zinc finger domain-containing protein [Metabacillus malikii]MDQ0232466.1 putative RNA-binding Zn ribbon-like protein [Metabacillus malikii]